jgi:regulator of sirC expression with transglutaminase-like and TPR domain
MAVAYAQRGDLKLAHQQDHRAALKDFNKALELDPKQMLALFGRGLLRNQSGDPVGAVADLKAVIALSAATPQEKWMQEQAKQQLPTIGAD